MSDQINASLKVGDYVLLKDMKFNSFMFSEGILLEDIQVTADMSLFEDMLFCIHLQRQYSASNEFDEFLKTYSIDEKNLKEEGPRTQRIYRALKKGRENERKLNDVYMKKNFGRPVLFGDVVQLYHVKSKKYLIVRPSVLAKNERENLRIGMDSRGDIYSWIQILPRFKIDKEGEPIKSSSEIYLQVAERAKEFYHCADRSPPPGKHREVNCSMEQTSWKIIIFQESEIAKRKGIALFSRLVYIHDPESKCDLSIGQKPLESLDDGEGVGDVGEDGGIDDENEIEEGENKSDQEGNDQFYHEHGDIILKPASLQRESGCLWFIESKTMIQGGAVKWKSEPVRLKHLNTGLYLCMKTLDEKDENGNDIIKLSTSPDGTSSSTLFNMNEQQSSINMLSTSKAIQIHQNFHWFGRAAEVMDDLNFAVLVSNDKAAAMNLIIRFFYQTLAEEEEADAPEDEEGADVVSIQKDERTLEPFDVFVGTTIRSYLQFYLYEIELPSGDTSWTIFPHIDKNEVDFFFFVMEKALAFINGHPIAAVKVNLEVDVGNALLKKARQRQYREQGLIEIVLKMVHKLTPITTKMQAVAGKKPGSVSEETQSLLRIGKSVLEVCFSFIFYCIEGNEENQMYVADFLSTLLLHLGGQPLAGKCVTEMLSKNMELQETKIGTREIAIFVDKLRSSKMDAMYLQLLQSCCSCEGEGVDGNQGKVTDLLFSNTNDIIIRMYADYTKVTPTDWFIGGLYIPNAPEAGSPILGDTLINKGLPKLSLSWTTNSIDYSPLGLFGKLSVNVEDLYSLTNSILNTSENSKGRSGGGGSAIAKKLQQKKSASRDQKIAVAKYFIAEMFLGAEMCLDRNYIAMHALDDYFTYESLVTVLKLDVSDKLKGAAARILMCLHIDRDPQAQSKIPCLTRAWSTISKFSSPQLPCVEPLRRNKFVLVQQILSDYIKKMAGVRWDQSAKHMVRLLRCLMYFNFYGTPGRMKDVISGLILALDRRSLPPMNTAPEPSNPKSKQSTPSSSASAQPSSSAAGSNSFEEMKEGADETMNEENVTNEEDTTLVPKVPWQERLLIIMESISTMMFVMLVVLIAVIVTIYQVISNANEEAGSPLYIWGIAVLIFFLLEIFIRGYCHIWVRGSVYTFFFNVFNVVDMVVISIDIIFLSLPKPHNQKGNSSTKSSLTKMLRLIRLVRLLRLLRAVKLVQAITNSDEISDDWKMPARYSKVPSHEIEAIVECVDSLLFAQSVIDDRNLSLLLRGFYTWMSSDERKRQSPSEIFEEVMVASQQLTLGSDDFDHIFIDNLMFVSTPLVQGALDILMNYHSMRRTLLENAEACQLLVSPRRERQFKVVDQMLQQLEQNADTHELWGVLKTDSDLAINKQTKDILKELRDICRVRRVEMEFDEDWMADRDIQDLYRNLGCFDITFKVLGLLDSIEEDEDTNELDDVGKNTLELVVLANELLYWFFIDNPTNQELGYGELDFFLDSLDDNIGSHKIIQAIFSMNEKLMKSLPHKYLNDMAEKICKDGKSHHYLSLFLSITHVGDKNMTENQFEIMKCLTSTGRLQKVGLYLCSTDHPDYEEKRQMMVELKGNTKCTIETIPPLLAYHLVFITVMAGCTVGRLNVTTVEAKVQTLFNYEWVIHSMLEQETILLAKVCMAKFIFNAIIEVEIMIPGLERNPLIWKMLRSFIPVLKEAIHEVPKVEHEGWTSANVNKQIIEYMVIAVMIIGSFFDRYFDPATFAYDAPPVGENLVPSILCENEINECIVSLFGNIKTLANMKTKILSEAHKRCLTDALVALDKSNKFVDKDDLKVVLTENNFGPSSTGANAREDLEDGDDGSEEREVHEKYKEFLAALAADEALQKRADNENLIFISVLESLPFIADNVDSDLRYEGLIRKLVAHTRENLVVGEKEKSLSKRCTKTTIWIMKAFRTMIENKMKMTIYERDEDGGEEQDLAAAPVVKALNQCGVTALCLDLIAVGIDEKLQNECIKLGVGLLFKEGGAIDVQKLMNDHLKKTNSTLFFKQIRNILQKLIAWHKWNDVVILEPGQDPELPDDIIVLRFLQLMSEGHYLPNQDFMREQPTNSQFFNLLDDFVVYLNCLSRIPCRTSSAAGIRLMALILEVLQGPSTGNQAHLVLNTELLETLNRILRAKVKNDCVPEDELEMKKIGIDIFQAVLEGQPLTSVIYERTLSVIHLDVVQSLAGIEPENLNKDAEGGGADDTAGDGGTSPGVDEVSATPSVQGSNALSEDEISLKTECTVLLQILCNYKPKLREDIGLSDDAGDGTSSVEVIWRGTLQRRFFHVPEICADLAKSSKDALVADVDRSNPENKLIDFLDRSHTLYSEIIWQQKLKEIVIFGDLTLSSIFSRKINDRCTMFSFILAIIVNALLLNYYTYDYNAIAPQSEKGNDLNPVIFSAININGGHISSPTVVATINALNYMQIIMAIFNLLTFLVVKSPVIMTTLEQSGMEGISLYIFTLLDGMCVYYIWYLVWCICATFYADFFNPFLLLDIIVKNSITRDVLNAVVKPINQLIWTLILMCFIMYIFAFFMFYYIPEEFSDDVTNNLPYDNGRFCQDLWRCYKFTFGYGLRTGGGLGDWFNHQLGVRLLFDLLFFLVVMVVMFNVVFGIIIDTFGMMRNERDIKDRDTMNICFICGIGKEVFDRNSDVPDGFGRHIKLDHNMWNYLYYIIFLWEQDKDDDDGLEQYVRRCVDAGDISWFPARRAICLKEEKSMEDKLKEEIVVGLSDSEKEINTKFTTFHRDLSIMLDGLTSIIINAGNMENDDKIIGEDLQFNTTVPSSDIKELEGTTKGGGGGAGGASVDSDVSDDEE